MEADCPIDADAEAPSVASTLRAREALLVAVAVAMVMSGELGITIPSMVKREDIEEGELVPPC